MRNERYAFPESELRNTHVTNPDGERAAIDAFTTATADTIERPVFGTEQMAILQILIAQAYAARARFTLTSRNRLIYVLR
jgi:hypothetical protein